MFAYAIFALGCLLCGISQSITQLIAARVFTGIGGGGMTTCVSSLLHENTLVLSPPLWPVLCLSSSLMSFQYVLEGHGRVGTAT
jgi:MFS family permease